MGNTYFSAHQRISEPLAAEQDYFERYQGKQYAPDRKIEEALDFIRQNRDKPFFLEDVLPTIAEMTGSTVPENIDGRSFLPALMGQIEKQQKHEYLYWEYHSYGGMQAVRLNIKKDSTATIQLFDLVSDLSETTNVAAQHPEIVSQVQEILNARSLSPVDRWNFPTIQ
ncbi:MAG: hypothetical protein ACE5I1_15735 [bacterium]